MSKQIVAGLDAYRDIRDGLTEALFKAFYGAPAVQAFYGVDPTAEAPLRKAGKSALHRELVERRIGELKARFAAGGLREAVVRAVIYVGMPRGGVDERGFETVRRIREASDKTRAIPLAEFKALLREQFFILLIDEEAAVAAIPALLPDDPAARAEAMALIRDVITAAGEPAGAVALRLARIGRMFTGEAGTPALTVVGGGDVTVREAS